MTASASAPNKDRGVDSWMDLAVRNVREWSYHIGRLFNRFSFHFDQAYALAYRFPKEGVAELRCAVSALNDIETAMKTFDPSRQDRWNALAEFRELIQDEEFLRRQFDGLREKCNAREAAPEVHEIQWLCTRDRAVLPTELLQALGHGDETAFQLGIVVDQGIRPTHVAAELYSATVSGESWPETSPQPVRPGDVQPEATWPRTLAKRLAEVDCVDLSRIATESGPELLASIRELDCQIRSVAAVDATPTALQISRDTNPPYAIWNGIYHELTDNQAWLLSALKDVYDDPQRRGELISGEKIGQLSGNSKFRVDQVRHSLPDPLRVLVETIGKKGSRLKL